ncbi:MAG: CPBP family intramembrane metalloprotease [Bifidobacteriaceae bacterium]|nr:CPBP family intramembrane metalloprotease [Bifidobacteriaceae bacterium]
MRLYRLIYDPTSRLREADLLPVDEPFKPYPPVHRVRFNAGLRLAVFIGAAMAVLVVAGLGVGVFFVAASFGSDSAGSSEDALRGLVSNPILAVSLELAAAIVGYMVLASAQEGRRWPVELAWRRAGGLLKGMALGFVAISVTVGLLALLGAYRIVGFNGAYSPWLDLLTLGVGAAVAEELLFRGVVFRLLEDTFGTILALAASSVVFGAVHLTNPDGSLLGAAGIAIEAVCLPAVYIATRSLWWSIGLHFAWNVTEGPIWGSIVSGTGEANSWLRAEWSGPEWLTGGAFGIEGSAALMVVMGALNAWLLVMAARSKSFVAPTWTRRRRLVERAASASQAAS